MFVFGPGDSLQGAAGTATAVTVTVAGVNVTVASGAETFGLLYQGQLPSAAGALFTVPAGQAYIVKTIIVTNSTGSSVSGVQLFQNGAAGASSIIGPLTIASHYTLTGSENGWAMTDAAGVLQTSASGGGSVISVSVVAANGFTGSVATPTTTPAITLNVDGTHYLPTTADQTNWNSKQASGSYITALTGDGTASGPGSAALTLASTSVTPGTYTLSTITVDAKGRITSASSGTPASGIPRSVTFKMTATGASDPIVLNYNATITGWSVIADVSGTVSADVWFIAASGAPPTAPNVPTVANKISASAPVATSSARTAAGGSSAISTWTTALTQWGTLIVNLNTLTTSTAAMIEIFLLET